MSAAKVLWLGFSLIVIFLLLGETIIIFRDFVFGKLNLDRNLIMLALWLLPILVSFLVTYLSQNYGALKALFLIIILSVPGSSVHFIFGELGATTNLSGYQGLKHTFQIYLVLGILTISLGGIVRVIFNKKKIKNARDTKA